MRDPIQLRLWLAPTIGLLWAAESYKKNYVYEYFFFLLNNEQVNTYFFLRFRLLHFFFSNYLYDIFTSHKSPYLSSIHWTGFFFKIIQHCETWNVIGLFPLYKLEEIELIIFFKSCIIQIFAHQICINLLFYAVKLDESYKLYNTNRLM